MYVYVIDKNWICLKQCKSFEEAEEYTKTSSRWFQIIYRETPAGVVHTYKTNNNGN